MPDVWLVWNGEVLRPSAPDDKTRLAKLRLNAPLKFSFSEKRSLQHLNMFFAAIRQAHDNWPESHSFQPDSPEHLRAWLLCKAGYRDTLVHEVKDGADPVWLADTIETSMRILKGHSFVVHDHNRVIVITPKSIAFAKLKQSEFNEISQDVSDVLHAEIGISLNDLKEAA
jgi:hypothetical protein